MATATALTSGNKIIRELEVLVIYCFHNGWGAQLF